MGRRSALRRLGAAVVGVALPAVGVAAWQRDRLAAADAECERLGSAALLVLHQGTEVHRWGDVARPLPCYSVRKSVLGMLFGIAQARGQVDLQATLGALGIDDKQGLTEQEKTATVQQLLQARSGVYHPAAYETAAMAAERPRRGSHAPGTHWYYNNWDFNALGTVYRQLTGTDVFTALERELAQPLDLQDFRREQHTRWVLEPASVHPAYTMELSARDLARIGQVMARDGRHGAQQLLPAAWVHESTRAWSIEPAQWQGYGYLWWVPHSAWPFWTRSSGQLFMAWGNFDQVMWVDRARDLVVVHRREQRFWRQSVGLAALTPLLQHVFAAQPA